jgi:hypothetical protein
VRFHQCSPQPSSQQREEVLNRRRYVAVLQMFFVQHAGLHEGGHMAVFKKYAWGWGMIEVRALLLDDGSKFSHLRVGPAQHALYARRY